MDGWGLDDDRPRACSSQEVIRLDAASRPCPPIKSILPPFKNSTRARPPACCAPPSRSVPDSVGGLPLSGAVDEHASARTMPLVHHPPCPQPNRHRRAQTDPSHTQQEPLKTKTMAKEKIYYKKLPWSPKLIGQPVGPLKGACVRPCVLFLFLTVCRVGLGIRNEPFGRGHARCVLVFCVVGIVGIVGLLPCRAGGGCGFLVGVWGLSCCLSRLQVMKFILTLDPCPVPIPLFFPTVEVTSLS